MDTQPAFVHNSITKKRKEKYVKNQRQKSQPPLMKKTKNTNALTQCNERIQTGQNNHNFEQKKD